MGIRFLVVRFFYSVEGIFRVVYLVFCWSCVGWLFLMIIECIMLDCNGNWIVVVGRGML